MKKITKDMVNWTISVEQDITPVRGNAMVSGDTELDSRIEDEILEELESGNVWAWGCVTVTGTYGGWESYDVLGGCSYVSEGDFIANSGYYADMQATILEDLNADIEGIIKSFSD